MTRNSFFTAMAVVIMMMTSVNSYAQGPRGNRMGNRGGNREMVMNNRGSQNNHRGQAMMGGNNMGNHNMGGQAMMHNNNGPHMMNNRPNMGGPVMAGHPHAGHMPHVDNRGFVPGWEGRVMYRDGRWGYLRNADWYWYDTYFEPEFYYGRPLDYFHSHIIPVDGRAVAAVAGVVAVGTLINLLAH